MVLIPLNHSSIMNLGPTLIRGEGGQLEQWWEICSRNINFSNHKPLISMVLITLIFNRVQSNINSTHTMQLLINQPNLTNKHNPLYNPNKLPILTLWTQTLKAYPMLKGNMQLYIRLFFPSPLVTMLFHQHLLILLSLPTLTHLAQTLCFITWMQHQPKQHLCLTNLFPIMAT